MQFLIRWLQKKPADVDLGLQCFQNITIMDSAGQGLNLATFKDDCNSECPSQFANRVQPRVYLRRITHGTMCEKALFC